jgi:Flp pilus assembly protein TadG
MRVLSFEMSRVAPDRQSRTALVEYALIAVAFCAILLTIVTMSKALRPSHSVDNAARDAARYAVAHDSACAGLTSGCPVGSAAVQTLSGIDPARSGNPTEQPAGR